MKENTSITETDGKKRLPVPDVKSLPAKLKTAKVSKVLKRGVLCVVAGAAVAGAVVYASMPDTVATQAAAHADITATVKESGLIAADSTVTVYAPVAGKFTDVAYRVNDMVAPGDLLAQYDLTSFERSYNTAKANTSYHQDGYAAAVNQNNKYQTKYDTAASNNEIYRQSYEQTQVGIDAIDAREHGKEMDNKGDERSYEKQIGWYTTELEAANSEYTAVDTAYEEAKIELAAAQAELDDYDKQISTATGQALADLQAQRQTVQAKYDRIKAEQDRLEKQKNSIKSNVNSLKEDIEKKRKKIADMDLTGMSKQEYEQYQALLRQIDLIERDWEQSLDVMNAADEHIVDEAQLAQYQDSVKLAKIEQDAAADRLAQAKDGVTTEIAGRITRKYVDSGAYVEAGAPLFEIQPLSGYKATVMISRFDIGSIALGQKADIVIGDTAYTGKVSAISPVAEKDASGKPKVKVDIALDDAAAAPTIGLEAEITIRVAEEKDVLSIPAEAVYTGDEGDYAYVLNAGIAEKRPIESGISGDGKVQVKDGIKEGELVITSVMTDDNIGTKYTVEE